MKNLVLITLFFAAIAVFGFTYQFEGEQIKWETDFDEAVQLAKQKNKKLLVLFTGSDWCYWCKKLEGEVFSKKEFITYASENFIAVKLDFPRRSTQTQAEKERNNALAQEYGIRGFPTVNIMNKDKQVLFQTGYQSGGSQNYINHLNKALEGK